MNAIIDAAFSRTRVVLLALVSIIATGVYAYLTVAKEANPEVPLPLVYVSTGLDGISPADAEELLLRPLETEFSGLENLEKMTSEASQGFASVQLEFTAGGDIDQALDRVREAADRAEGELPEDAYDLSIVEFNTALFPIITVVLSGSVPERKLNDIADSAQEALEALPGILEVDIGGQRTEFLEILIDPTVFETYQLSFDEIVTQIQRNNRLIAAGAIETGQGRIVLKVPGLIEDRQDILQMPVKVSGNAVVTFGDVATIRRVFEDADSFARIDGQPALSLEVTKRSGANIIETIADVKSTIDTLSKDWPDKIDATYLQDQSEQVKTLLSDLEANVIAAVILVMIVIVFALGLRSAVLVGLAIPGAFLSGVIGIWALGFTMNVIVLFALILVVGMLVDGAIVTVELADRKLQEGASRKKAYAFAAKRMAWPIIASTATTLSVFFPLLFWTGVTGEFMKYLPATVIMTLFASLFMALIFIPVVGGVIGKRQPQTASAKSVLRAAEVGDPRDTGGATGVYVKLLQWAILRPGATLLGAVALLVTMFAAYAEFGRGVTFFPSIEPEFMRVEVRARDNLSIWERDTIVRAVEDRLQTYNAIDTIYARTILNAERGDEETIGVLQLDLVDWENRRTADELGTQMRNDLEDIAGVDIEVQTDSNGPTQGKPINLQLRTRSPEIQEETAQTVLALMNDIGGFTDVTDTRPLPGVEVSIEVDRSEAARYGADVSLLGQAVQLLTQGIEVADYRPSDTDDEIEIRIRFTREERSLSELNNLRVPTRVGLVPISNFVTLAPAERVGTLRRIDERRVVTIEADVAPGVLVADQITALRNALEQTDLPQGVQYTFAGEAEEQRDAAQFLSRAFVVALLLMTVILLIQFNSFFQAAIVMSAIIFSVAGVLLGLLITGRPFGIVMGGIGVIALAGIVVNNNIVLIDTFNDLRRRGVQPLEAALRTGTQRLRPVVLTSVTTALGLMPMVLGLKLDFFTREIVYGAPSTQWWTELSSAIVGGLTVATVLTLLVSPALLVMNENYRHSKIWPKVKSVISKKRADILR